MPVALRCILGTVIVGLVVGVPFVHYRHAYAENKRLREVAPSVLYRSGQMTVEGFEEAIARYRIRTIVNLQDEYPDPDLQRGGWGGGSEKETDLCRRLGVRYVYLPPDLIPRRQVGAHRPQAIDRFLSLLDDPANFPLLIHCKAGLHRTGVMTAVFRMEYQGYTPDEAIRDLKTNGFGHFACTAANDYITQYVLSYRPGQRRLARDPGERQTSAR